MLTNPELCGIISSCSTENTEKTKFGNNLFINGGIAQLARAIGSYPIGRGFKSNFRYHASSKVQRKYTMARVKRPVGQAVKTPPFHGGNGSSILPRVIRQCRNVLLFAFCPESEYQKLPANLTDGEFHFYIKPARSR